MTVSVAGVARLCGGLDISQYPPDGPLPPLPPSNAARARQQMIIEMGTRGMTIREIGRVLGMSQAHRVAYGTPVQLADDMQEWLEAEACDGFNLLFAHYPKPLEEFVTLVSPNCNGAVSSGLNMRARRSVKIWACRSQPTSTPRTAPVFR